MSWGAPRRPKISTKLGNPNPREGSDGDIQIKGTALGARLWGKWSGRWWDVPLSKDGVTKFGVTDSDYLSIDNDSVDIYKKGKKVAEFGETVTIGGIVVNAPLNASDTTSGNLFVGNTNTGGELTANDLKSIENVVIGTDAMKFAEYARENVFIGYEVAMNFGDDCASGAAVYQNVAIGNRAYKCVDSSNVVGAYNVAIGFQSMEDCAGGNGNTCVGYRSGESLSGSENTLIGSDAGYASGDSTTKLTSGTNNICISAGSGTTAAVTAANDTTHAVSIGYGTQAGDNAIAIGKGRNEDNTANPVIASGTDSIAIGTRTDATAAGSIAIGNGAQCSIAQGLAIGDSAVCDEAHSIAIGHGVNTTATQRIAVGDTSYYTYELNFGGSGNSFAAVSDVRVKRDIVDSDLGLNFINELRPVKYRDINPHDQPDDVRPKKVGERPDDSLFEVVLDGFIAQEVKGAIDKLGVTFNGWEKDGNMVQRLQYAKFVLPLTKAVQELSAKLDTIQTEINTLKEG